jgi:RES domain-containing protein
MRVFRIARKPFARYPLDGRGGLFAAGRWHTPRRLVVYTSSSLALASLEVLVHTDIDLVPTDLVAIEISIPDDLRIKAIPVSKFPRTWRKYPTPRSLQKLGDSWLDGVYTCVLRVPSAVIPTESNFLLNPKHADMLRIKVVRKFDFRFDSRVITR